jgi:PKHD-type hydroxylase
MRFIRNNILMNLILQAVLGPEELAQVRERLRALAWAEGKRTAGAAAAPVKQNLQAKGDDPRTLALERFAREALERHQLFAIAARPHRFSRLLFSRYEPGMAYGAHTDDALMASGAERLRTDLAFTLFLSDAAAYEGGALALETAMGEQAIKLEAGDAVLYSAGSIHRVTPVTQGVRLACVGWIQSLVADSGQREILFDLSLTRARLGEAGAAREEMLRLDKAISNLLRQWALV